MTIVEYCLPVPPLPLIPRRNPRLASPFLPPRPGPAEKLAALRILPHPRPGSVRLRLRPLLTIATARRNGHPAPGPALRPRFGIDLTLPHPPDILPRKTLPLHPVLLTGTNIQIPHVQLNGTVNPAQPRRTDCFGAGRGLKARTVHLEPPPIT